MQLLCCIATANRLLKVASVSVLNRFETLLFSSAGFTAVGWGIRTIESKIVYLLSVVVHSLKRLSVICNQRFSAIFDATLLTTPFIK